MRTDALKSERKGVGSHSADAIDSGKQRPKGWTITPEAGEEGGISRVRHQLTSRRAVCARTK